MLAALSLGSLTNILWVALGLGLVIFFHELGHFLVAKWCDVHVERFSIGFGPILLAWKWGETEYALSAIPFGGYVKMLGQDDVDPSQLTSEEIAMDPRSYSAKPVWQRMAIISAGVTMNILTAVLFYATAFALGQQIAPPVIGSVKVGMPAWEAGIERGDVITRIDGRDVDSFTGIYRGTALSTGVIDIEGRHRDGTEYRTSIIPDRSGARPEIGVGFTSGTQLADPDEPKFSPTNPGSGAAAAEPSFERGDIIKQVGGDETPDFAALQDAFAVHRAETVEVVVERRSEPEAAPKTVMLTVPPTPFRTLGMIMDVGQIVAIQEDSPADKGGLREQDKLAKINGAAIGTDIDPLRLPDLFAELAGQDVEVTVVRQISGGGIQESVLTIVPEPRLGWINAPMAAGDPLAIPAIGAAYQIIPVVLRVEEGSPAAVAGIPAGASIKSMDLELPSGAVPDRILDKIAHFDFGEQNANNWAYAFWIMQQARQRTVTIEYSHAGKLETVSLTPTDATDWYMPSRGVIAQVMLIERQAESLGQALSMGASQTRNSMLDIYLTLRNLITGALSWKALHGPIGIAMAAYEVARHGLTELLMFLGFLSVNLAVLNFLPIPVLDGGHMVFLMWEGITRRRPSEKVLVAATYAGMAFVLGLMLLVIYLDIFVHKLQIN